MDEFNVIKKFLLSNFGEHAFMGIKNPDYVKYAEAFKLNKPCIIDAIIDGDVYPPMNISKT